MQNKKIIKGKIKRKIKGHTLIIFIFILLSLSATVVIPNFCFFRATALVIEEPSAEKILWAAPLKENEEFQLRYIHSVDLTPVYEIYTNKNGALVLKESRFMTWGAGLGYMGEGLLEEEDGWTVIRQMERRLESLPLRIGTIAEHTIIYRQKEILLQEFAPPQSLVNIRLRKKLRKASWGSNLNLEGKG